MKTVCEDCEYSDITLEVVPRPVRVGYDFMSQPKIETSIYCKKQYKAITKLLNKCPLRLSKKNAKVSDFF